MSNYKHRTTYKATTNGKHIHLMVKLLKVKKAENSNENF